MEAGVWRKKVGFDVDIKYDPGRDLNPNSNHPRIVRCPSGGAIYGLGRPVRDRHVGVDGFQQLSTAR